MVSARSQGTEDFVLEENSSQLSIVTTPLPDGEWSRVFEFASNASDARLGYPIWADNHTAPSAGTYMIAAAYVRFGDVSPTADHKFFRFSSEVDGTTTCGLTMNTSGEIELVDKGNNVQATESTTVPSVDTWHLFEVRFLPSETASSADGEAQVWMDGTELFGGNVTSIDYDVAFALNVLSGFRGNVANTPATTYHVAGSYSMINSTSADDRLGTFEIIGPYGCTNFTAAETEPDDPGRTSPPHGILADGTSDLDDGSWDVTQNIPFSDEALGTAAEYIGSNTDGLIFCDTGTRSGPSSDSRIDGTIKAAKMLWRGDRETGGGTTHNLWLGNSSDTTTTEGAGGAITLATGFDNYYIVSDDTAKIPTSSQFMALGFGKSGAQDIVCTDMCGMILHVPAAGATHEDSMSLAFQAGHAASPDMVFEPTMILALQNNLQLATDMVHEPSARLDLQTSVALVVENVMEEAISLAVQKAIAAVRETAKHGSKMEKFIQERLTEAGYVIECHKKGLIANANLEIDIYLPEHLTVLEIDGPSHFLPIWGEDAFRKTVKSDNEKNGLVLGHGFVVIRVKQVKKNLSINDMWLFWEAISSTLEYLKKGYPKTREERFIEIELKPTKKKEVV